VVGGSCRNTCHCLSRENAHAPFIKAIRAVRIGLSFCQRRASQVQGPLSAQHPPRASTRRRPSDRVSSPWRCCPDLIVVGEVRGADVLYLIPLVEGRIGDELILSVEATEGIGTDMPGVRGFPSRQRT